MRIGLGCMRLSTELERDEDVGVATIAAALDAGVTLFDTARAYGNAEADVGHNERLLARVFRARAVPPHTRIVTKCGMRRVDPGAAWVPDGRAKRIAEDAAASVEALGGIPIDVLLLHAPDPGVSLATTARALARARNDGLARSVGVSNVTRKQLEEMAEHAPISAVELALGAYDHLAIRSGVVAYCLERGIEIFAYAPLGGPERARKVLRDPTLKRIAAHHAPGTNACEVFLAYLLAVRPELVPIVGARRPETIARMAAASRLVLDEEHLVALDARFPVLGMLRRPPAVVARNGEVVMMMGVPGAGKSRAAEVLVARGYERLNRDAMGGTLRGVAQKLEERLRGGAERLVLDNTYVSRATRNDVVRIASAQGARVRCMFFDTPAHEAQVNIVLRMLERFGRVVEPEDMAGLARQDPAALGPHALATMTRNLEPPAADEGFSSIEVVPFVRDRDAGGRAGGRPALVVALDALKAATLETALVRILAPASDEPNERRPCLLYSWRREPAALAAMRAVVSGLAGSTGQVMEIALCPHPAGPPICWCRPPLPGLFLTFARRHGVDLRASTLVGASPTDRTIARVLEMTFREHDPMR